MERIDVIDEAPFGMNYINMEMETALQNDMDADDTLRKIDNWERYRKFWLDYYKKKVDEVNQRCDNNIEFNKRKLRDYFKIVPHRKTKTQEAYDLPSGKLSVTYKQASFIPDRQAIIARLKASGDTEFVKVKTSEDLDWSGYKERLSISEDGQSVLDRETGEVVTDVEIDHPVPEFKVTTKKENGGHEDGREEAV